MKTQHQELIDLFRRHGFTVSLGQIMQTNLACAYRGRMSELRQKGYQFVLKRGETPSRNLYTMVEPDKDGQMRIA